MKLEFEDFYQDCPQCKGSGILPDDYLTIFVEHETCYFCNRTGKVPTEVFQKVLNFLKGTV